MILYFERYFEKWYIEERSTIHVNCKNMEMDIHMDFKLLWNVTNVPSIHLILMYRCRSDT
jgi:hypothetical protein